MKTPKKKRISAYNMYRKRMKANENCAALSVDSRPRRRAAARKDRIAQIDAKFGPEVRSIRRDFALRPFRQKNRLKGPRAGRARLRVAVSRFLAQDWAHANYLTLQNLKDAGGSGGE